ncbi:MAG: hypothetical protein WDO17_04230 [Alphaproteobacteria bacterium]
MPEIIVPHRVVYYVEQPVPVADVVSALLATEQLLRETAPLLESCVPGLTIERVGISVRNLSQESPFVQSLIVAIYALHQKDLDKAMSKLAEQFYGAPVPEAYNSLLSLAFVILLLYGAEAIRNQVSKKAYSQRIRQQLDSVARELSGECGVSEERIKKILEKQYGKSRLRVLTRAAIDFFRPSKRDHNAPVVIGNTNIDADTISEIPNEAEIEGADAPEISRMVRDVTIELHAQDVDRAKQGWAGVVREIAPKRIRIELEPPIKPEQVYMKSIVRGDAMLVLRKRADGSYHPAALHLLDITHAE